jgi:hypothetical protein
MNQEIFTAPARRQHTLAFKQHVKTNRKRPAQTAAALDHAGDVATFEERCDAAAGDFDFG